MDKTIIHIGLHKTATTFFQNSVWPFVQGYTYLSRPYTQCNHAFSQLQYADDTLYKKDKVIAELKQVAARRLIISDESFSGKPIYFSYLNRTIIAKRLKELFPNADIVLFLRDQRDIMLSHYSSYIKMPYGMKRPEDLFYKPLRNYTYSDYVRQASRYDMHSLYYNTNDYFFHLDCFLYLPLVELYKSLFDNFHIFLYEEFVSDKVGTALRLEEIVGERIKFNSSTPSNVSLSYRELEGRRKANLLSPLIGNRYAMKLAQIATKLLPNEMKDLQAIINEIVGEYYSKDNSSLKEKLPQLAWEKHPDKYT